MERIKELRAILGDEERVLGADQGGAARDQGDYGDERRTEITPPRARSTSRT